MQLIYPIIYIIGVDITMYISQNLQIILIKNQRQEFT